MFDFWVRSGRRRLSLHEPVLSEAEQREVSAQPSFAKGIVFHKVRDKKKKAALNIKSDKMCFLKSHSLANISGPLS